MRELKNDEPFYLISQASKLLGITCDRLRTYEEELLIKPYRAKHSQDGKRLFSKNDIDWLVHIRELIKLGVSVPTVRILLVSEISPNKKFLKEKDLQIVSIIEKLKTHAVYGLLFQ